MSSQARIILPARFTQTIPATFGEAGATWLTRLPSLLDEYRQRWSLTLHPPFANLTYHYVVPATRADGLACVLKLGVPNPELTSEAAALRVYDGRGAARLVAAETANGALLLERLQPGAPLSQLEDDAQATSIAAQVMRQLWRPAPEDGQFYSLRRWFRALGEYREQYPDGNGPLAASLVERAAAVFDELMADPQPAVLLHGDLHHDNILAAARAPWLAIDPKGLVGDPGFEVGALLYNYNPMPRLRQMPNLRGVLARRVDQLADELGLDRNRLLAWGFASAVLSAVWSVEDKAPDDWATATLTIAQSLADLMIDD